MPNNCAKCETVSHPIHACQYGHHSIALTQVWKRDSIPTLNFLGFNINIFIPVSGTYWCTYENTISGIYICCEIYKSHVFKSHNQRHPNTYKTHTQTLMTHKNGLWNSCCHIELCKMLQVQGFLVLRYIVWIELWKINLSYKDYNKEKICTTFNFILLWENQT